MRKLCLECVLRLFTVDEKEQHIDDSERCLNLYKRNKHEVLRRYLTMDETFIHYNKSESKRSSNRQLLGQPPLKAVQRDLKLKRQLYMVLTCECCPIPKFSS
ncbi:hypothetical protein TNCV_334371 [Trichonephila clavipes]|nr:hypothetical protein TNCV_334371 [Trichonephila clavipes]